MCYDICAQRFTLKLAVSCHLLTVDSCCTWYQSCLLLQTLWLPARLFDLYICCFSLWKVLGTSVVMANAHWQRDIKPHAPSVTIWYWRMLPGAPGRCVLQQQQQIGSMHVSQKAGRHFLTPLQLISPLLAEQRCCSHPCCCCSMLQGCVPMGEADWERARITQGRPAAGAELTEHYNPYEAGLCHAVSVSKGCYIGQETLAKVGS